MEAVRAFRGWMRVSVALYALGGLAFAVSPSTAHGDVDALFRLLPGLSAWDPMPATLAHSWTALSVSMMATISACCWFAAKNPLKNKDFAVPVMVSKAVSSVGGILLLLVHARYAIYLVLFTTDFPLFLLTLFLWRRLPATVAAAPEPVPGAAP
jgi:hypothetical protein